MGRSRHQKKEIEKVVRIAERLGWTFESRTNHLWGCIYCTGVPPDRCRVNIFSTPSSPENHAKYIAREVAKCPHTKLKENKP